MTLSSCKTLLKHTVSVILFLRACTANDISKAEPDVDTKCITDPTKEKCVNNFFCNRTYTTVYLDVPPYSRLPVDYVFGLCCGACFKMKSSKEKIYRTEVAIKNVTGIDFAFPVFGGGTSIKLGAMYFLPMIKHSGFYYVTKIRKSSFELAISSCLQMWPMLLIFIFLSITFGFIFWLFEAHHTDSEYSKAFPIGWVKASWWGLISLVSQGPESTPKSVLARLFAFLWIFVAVILVGIVTSIITATMVRSYPTPSMDGKTVVTVSNRTYNELIILENHGRPHVVKKKNDTYSEVGHVLELGLSDGYGGALIDKYLYKAYMAEIRVRNFKVYDSLAKRIFLSNIPGAPDAYYGIGLLDKSIYEYYKTVFQLYIIESQIQILRAQNNIQSDPENTIQKQISELTDPVIFDIKQPFVKDGLIYCSITLACFFVIGSIYEGIRRKRKVKTFDT